MTVEKIWTKDFSVVWVIHFVITIVFYLLLVTIGQYAIEKYYVSISIAGLVSGIFVVGSLIGRLIAGRFLSVQIDPVAGDAGRGRRRFRLAFYRGLSAS